LQQYHSEKHLSEFYPQDGGESQLASKLRHCRPMYTRNKYVVGSPYSRTEIYAARVSHAADDAHRPPLHGFAAAARTDDADG